VEKINKETERENPRRWGKGKQEGPEIHNNGR